MLNYLARWVVPVAAPPIADGIVAVEGERIAWVGSAADAPRGELTDLGDVVLAPGLVNTHTHLELTAMRGFLETQDFAAWVTELTLARREALDAEALLRAARAGIREGVLAGITTFADTGSSGAPIRAMTETGVRGIAFHEVFGPDPAAWRERMADFRAALAALAVHAGDRVTLGISPHAPYSVSAELYAAAADLARERRYPVAIHCAESADEASYVLAGAGPFAEMQQRRGIDVRPRGLTPVAWLETTGILARRPLLIHCVGVDDADIARIAAAGCAVAHCPASNAKLGHGIAPFAALRDAGIPVGVGTDSVASSNHMDVLAEARLAALFARAVARRHDLLDPHSVIRLTTIDGARALGLDDAIGSLEPGKMADLAAFSLASSRAAGAADPEATLAFALTGADARFVAVGGEPLLVDGVPAARLGEPDDLGDLAARLEAWRAAR